MDGYSLSRQWFDWCFENPEKIKPNHGALFFYIIEHCNRLGWKDKFGLPTTVTMEAIGIKSYNTYIDALRDLVAWGFIEMVEKSKNQYTANIIALLKNDKAHNKALDKAMIKHGPKQRESTGQSTGESISSINKQLTIKHSNTEQINYSFDVFWNLYDKKVGSKEKIEKKWFSLTDEERKIAIEHISKYKAAQPNKGYRKNPKVI
jgi:uncharacterized protein YoaH (UPF0181 family)